MRACTCGCLYDNFFREPGAVPVRVYLRFQHSVHSLSLNRVAFYSRVCSVMLCKQFARIFLLIRVACLQTATRAYKYMCVCVCVGPTAAVHECNNIIIYHIYIHVLLHCFHETFTRIYMYITQFIMIN